MSAASAASATSNAIHIGNTSIESIFFQSYGFMNGVLGTLNFICMSFIIIALIYIVSDIIQKNKAFHARFFAFGDFLTVTDTLKLNWGSKNSDLELENSDLKKENSDLKSELKAEIAKLKFNYNELDINYKSMKIRVFNLESDVNIQKNASATVVESASVAETKHVAETEHVAETAHVAETEPTGSTAPAAKSTYGHGHVIAYSPYDERARASGHEPVLPYSPYVKSAHGLTPSFGST